MSSCTAFAAAIAVVACVGRSPGRRTHSVLDSERDRRGEAALLVRCPVGSEFHLAAETLAGGRVAIGGPGPVRLVEVWATWCEPCALAAVRARTVLARHPRVLAYAVALDVDRETVSRYVAMTPPPGTPLVLLGDRAAAARHGLDRVPAFIAIDARGRVTGAITGLSPGLGPALDRLLRHAEGAVGERE